jgi:Bacteriophage T4-like portal protein (Gp20)
MAENSKKGTIYQNLNGFFNFDGFGFAPQQVQDTTKIIIKGNTPEEIHRKSLEIEQKNALQNKFFRTTDRGFQKALQYEAARLPAYIDYEGMEYYPIISSALDLFMEEATTIGPNGKMLNIYSNKERIKFLLEEFFYDIINVNVNLPFWTRNVVKYGDNFVLLYGERKKGITHVKQMVNYEIERYERIQKGKPTVKFKERMTGDEFNIFEVAHFRLLGDDKYLPYGSSILNKIRRVFRQLVMAEDAMLTYRLIRAGEKKVFKIDVGNIDEEDIEEYMYKVATKFKRLPEVNGNSGSIDYRFNILGNDEDYFLPVRNANVQTGIDTLPGATNLDQIQDIEYLRDNLFTGLGVPKPFLSFQDAAGGGKNMAQYDIRFAKKINRIQQSIIQELNKMAMVHLYLLGYTQEDLSNFTLTLTNPSTQQDLLKAELNRERATTYSELTRGENGMAAMSHTNAKRTLFNMSDKEIIEDLKQQKMEKVIMQELADAPIIIKKSGVFADIDKRYGEPELMINTTGTTEQEIPPEEGMPGGDMGAPTGPAPIPGLSNQTPADLPPIQPEGQKKTKPLLSERRNKRIVYMTKDTYKNNLNDYNNLVNELVNGDNVEKETIQTKKEILKETENQNNDLNSKAEEMVSEIDELIIKSKKVKKPKIDEAVDNDDINLEDINLDSEIKDKENKD